MYCNYEQNDWADLLDTAAFVYNNTVHNSIGVSPFFACYGWNPKAHPDIPQRLGVNDPGRFEYLMDGKERCKYLQEQIREAQRRTVDQYNRKHKDIEFKVGDMVYINRRNWKTRRPTPKLDTRFAGPYPVQERVGRRAYRITLPANLRVHDVFHVSMLEPAKTSSLPHRTDQPIIPSLPDEDLDFEVEALVDKRSFNGTTEYKVLWRGYSEEAASWEPVENLNCPDLIQERATPDKRILQAALEDGPIGFMLLEEPPSSLPAFGFVPTGADKGVEMEVEIDKVVTAADIPKPYQHLRDVFDEVEADKLPHHTEHDLHLELIEGGKPPQGPLYLKGPKEMSELRRYLDENLEKGFIRPSKSPARSPVLFVPKKDGGLRLCVDYRGLNEITVKNRAPLPLIEEQLFLLRKARIYTKLDLRAAYNLIRIAKGDEWKTAFCTQLGLYEYLVMPFGLANAPAHFQSFINDIFRDIIGVYVVVYLDDFLIFSDTEEVHVKHVTEVLTRLRSNRLFAKLSKCEFHTKTVEFLGYIIKPTGIEMDPEKVRTVKEWPMPESIHDIQRFLGFANFYRRFIAHFAHIAKPLTSLVKPIEQFKKFELPEEAQQAFHKLIQAFTSAGVLQHFDYHLPTRLETDASDFAIAGVLKQEHEG
ncbi:hypothetical protein NDA15_003774 [Ustilago hordei]|nr:hypothetical protein NDA15_003774 [Ustilago hordei]